MFIEKYFCYMRSLTCFLSSHKPNLNLEYTIVKDMKVNGFIVDGQITLEKY